VLYLLEALLEALYFFGKIDILARGKALKLLDLLLKLMYGFFKI